MELIRKSFLKQRIIYGEDSYTMHMLIRGCLGDSRGRYKNSTADVLDDFWQNYFGLIGEGQAYPDYISNFYVGIEVPELLRYGVKDSFMFVDAYEEDFRVFSQIISIGDKHSFNLAVFLAANGKAGSKYFLSWGAPDKSAHLRKYEEVLAASVDIVIEDMASYQDHEIYSDILVSRIILAYYNIFSQYLDGYDSELLRACEMKIMMLQAFSERSEDTNQLVMMIRYSFHNIFVDQLCLQSLSGEEICRHRWRYRLLLIYDHHDSDSNSDDLQSRMYDFKGSAFFGMMFYASMDDHNATLQLASALNFPKDSVKAVQNSSNIWDPVKAIIFVTLYDIFLRHGVSESLNATLHHIYDMHSQFTTMKCYSSVYGCIIIPFLWSIGEGDLARDLCNVWLDNYKIADMKCDHFDFRISRENIVFYSFCETN